jgi:hypothetical protein
MNSMRPNWFDMVRPLKSLDSAISGDYDSLMSGQPSEPHTPRRKALQRPVLTPDSFQELHTAVPPHPG